MNEQGRVPGPQITLEDINSEIVGEYYFTGQEGVFGAAAFASDSETPVSSVKYPIEQTLGLLTFCVLVLRNGFTVTGESACVSAENFHAQYGRDLAREKAIDKCWPLLGYKLRCDLYDAGK